MDKHKKLSSHYFCICSYHVFLKYVSKLIHLYLKHSLLYSFQILVKSPVITNSFSYQQAVQQLSSALAFVTMS